ncbi:MAG TPA: hypothetical protein VNL15_07305 [Dehalococcoidia bacterium]|nr:hypothetical protein [Dehalococcoidia bacterium]
MASTPMPTTLDLSPALLTLADLPAGWQIRQISGQRSTIVVDPCGLTGIPYQPIGRATADFSDAPTGRYLSQVIAAYEPGMAAKALQALKDAIVSCQAWQHAHMAPLAIGEQGIILQVPVQFGPLATVTMDFVVFQRGDTLVTLAHSAISPAILDSKQTEAFARRADEKLLQFRR